MTEALIGLAIVICVIVIPLLFNLCKRAYIKKKKRCPKCGGKYVSKWITTYTDGKHKYARGGLSRFRMGVFYGKAVVKEKILACEDCGLKYGSKVSIDSNKKDQ